MKLRKVLPTCIAVLLTVLLCAFALPTEAKASEIIASGTCGENLTWTLDDAGTLNISGTGDMWDYGDDPVPWGNQSLRIKQVVIMDGVTSIGDYAFFAYDRLTSIAIPNGVTSIGECAFFECYKLASITIPDSVTTIGDSAFANCESLVSITIPDSVENIGDWTFSNCYSLTSITLPVSATSIGDYAFVGCTGLTSITIPDSVTSIGHEAFFGCESLTSITIPDSVTSIGRYAFSFCTGLTSVTIGNGVTSIGYSVFEDCDSLTSVTIGDSVTSIVNYAFSGCFSLTSITIPDSVTSIGYAAFRNCTGLTSVTFGNGVTSIGREAFSGCFSLTSITIPDSVTSIGDYAFSDCISLTNVILGKGVTSIGNFALDNNLNLTNLIYCGTPEQWEKVLGNENIGDFTLQYHKYENSVCVYCNSVMPFEYTVTDGKATVTGCDTAISGDVTIPDTLGGYPVTAIGNSAFSDCDSLTSVTIPDSVTSIRVYAFSSCSSLTGIWVNENNPNYSSDAQGVLFNKDKTQLIQAPGSISGSYTVPDSATSIDNYAFENCAGLTEITIPNSVTVIGYSAFRDCAGLTAIVIPDSVTSIGKFAFSGCSGLERMTIPFVGGSIKNASDSYQYPFGFIFGEDSYTGGVATTQYYCGSPATSSMNSTYYIPESLRSVTVTGGNILEGAFENCAKLTSITLPDDICSIGPSAFRGCNNLTDITIPEGVTTIGNGAFYWSGITSIVIPNTVTTIDKMAFYGCALTSIVIPDSVTTLGEGVFRTCGRLESVTIGNGITSIPDATFYYCDSLKNIVIGNKVTTIGENAFYDCNKLSNVTIGNSVTNIGKKAFWHCDSLTNITIPDSVKSIGESAFAACNLTHITIGKGVTSIGNSAFGGCVSLERVDFNAINCTQMGEGVQYSQVFSNCAKLKTVNIGDGVTAIPSYAFVNSNLKAILIPDSVISIGKYALNIVQTVFYSGSENDKLGIDISDGNFTGNIKWHYEVANATFAGQDCCYCPECNTCFLPNGEYAMATVTFCNWDGTELSKQSVRYNGEITAPTDPTKAADNTYTYTFAGWDKELICTGNMTITATYTPVYIDYTVEFKNWDGTVLSSKTYHYGDAVTVPTTPTKTADNIYTYTFAGWNKAVINCAGNAIYTATYTSNYIDYTVRFVDVGGAVLSTGTYHWGDAITAPTDPSKAADNTYTYTFAGWDKELVCAGDMTINATYTPKYIDYTVIFVDEDGTELSKKTYHYGDAVAAPVDPTKAADNTYTYTFAGWDKELVCIGNMTITATYTPHYINYTVEFKNWDGTVLSTEVYHYGDVVTAPTKPAKAADNTYTYTFAGWDKALVCAGDMTINATYTPVYIDYTVEFKNWNGEVLSSKTYHYGDVITAPVDPTKAADNTYTYTFAGWDKEIVNCVGNVTYTATYTPIYIDYNVIFVDEDGTELSKKTYHWGDAVVAPTDPTKAADNTYTYTFAGWDKEIVNCVGNVTYTATYTPIYIDYTVIFVDEDGTELSKKTYHWGDAVVAPTDPTKDADNTYTYTFAGWDKELICSGDMTITATYTPVYIDYTVIFVDEDGTELSRKTYHWGDAVVAPADPVKDADNTYTYTFAGWDKEVVNCAGDVTYTATYTPKYIDYTVIFVDENGTELSRKTYHWGDAVAAPVAPTKAADNTYTYTFAGWDKEVVNCAGNTTYTATYTPTYINYTVEFKNWDGTIHSSMTYHWGDIIEIPVAPVRERDDYYMYTFAGWGKEIGFCCGNAEYKATFVATHYHTYSALCDTTCNLCGATNHDAIPHDYKAATCTAPKTCKTCGATEGVALGHDYADATCTAPKTCKNCGATSGSKLDHDYKAATCTAPKTCKTCKATSGKALGHSYKAATCTAPKTCKNCGATSGSKLSHTYKTVTTKATLSKNGKVEKKCSVCGYVSSSTTIRYAKTIKLSATSYTYSGGVKTPAVTVKDSAGKTLKKNTDYTVSYASGRKNVGTYKVTITFKGKYSGTKVLTFKINPKAASVNKLTAKTKGLTVKLNRQTVQSTGYEIQYATSKTFKSAKTTTASYSTSTKSISGLKAKTTYYVRVRTYKTVSGVKYYSGWSTAKYIKTK